MRVMIASRDKALTRLLQGILHLRNHSALIVEREEEVLSALADGNSQVVILEEKLMEFRMVPLCREIKNRWRNTWILAALRDQRNEEMDALLDVGVSDFLLLPLDATSARCRILALERQVQNWNELAAVQKQEMNSRPFHDPLTGLPSRALFLDRVGLAIARSKRKQNYFFAVLYLAFREIQLIRKSLGKSIAEQVLVTIARRLEACIRPGDSVAHTGEDEFAILLDDLAEIKDAKTIAHRLEEQLRRPFVLEEMEIETVACIGITGSDTQAAGAEALLRDAELAMYRVKQASVEGAKALVRALGERQAEDHTSWDLSAANS